VEEVVSVMVVGIGVLGGGDGGGRNRMSEGKTEIGERKT